MDMHTFIGALSPIAINNGGESQVIGSGSAGSLNQVSEKSPVIGLKFQVHGSEYQGAGWVHSRQGKEFVSLRITEDGNNFRYVGFLHPTKSGKGLVGNVWHESADVYKDKAEFALFVSDSGDIVVYPPMVGTHKPAQSQNEDDEIPF